MWNVIHAYCNNGDNKLFGWDLSYVCKGGYGMGCWFLGY